MTVRHGCIIIISVLMKLLDSRCQAFKREREREREYSCCVLLALSCFAPRVYLISPPFFIIFQVIKLSQYLITSSSSYVHYDSAHNMHFHPYVIISNSKSCHLDRIRTDRIGTTSHLCFSESKISSEKSGIS
jgi:hypothetical protein